MSIVPLKYQLKFTSELDANGIRRYFITDYTYNDTPTVRKVSPGIFAKELQEYSSWVNAIYGTRLKRRLNHD